MERIKTLFCKHPTEQGETYLGHARVACSIALHLMVSATCLALHGVLPFICPPEPHDLKSTQDYLENIQRKRDLSR